MIDIIITIYNTPIDALIRCFNSIIKQKNEKWNVIIIDDGSKKEIAKWLDNYCNNNQKFSVYHFKNNGISEARNIGIKLSQNDYITFVDSDDEITESFLSDAYTILDNYDVDLIIGSTEIDYGNNKKTCAIKQNKYIEGNSIKQLLGYMLSSKNSKNEMYFNNILVGRTYPKIYKKSVLNIVKFDNELFLHEDNLFSIDVLTKVDKVYVTDKIWYIYYQNDYSITHSKYDEKFSIQELLFADKIRERKPLFEKNGVVNQYYYRIATIAILYLKMLINQNRLPMKSINRLFEQSVFNEIIYLKVDCIMDVSKKDKFFIKILKIKSKKIKILIFSIIVSISKIIHKRGDKNVKK